MLTAAETLNAAPGLAVSGAVTRSEFDHRSRLTRRSLPTGAVHTLTWDDADRVTSVHTAAPDAPAALTRYVFDGAERIPSQVVDPEGGVTRLVVAGGVLVYGARTRRRPSPRPRSTGVACTRLTATSIDDALSSVDLRSESALDRASFIRAARIVVGAPPRGGCRRVGSWRNRKWR